MSKKLIDKVVRVIAEVRGNTDYITTAIEAGKMDPYLKAICISGSENWEALSSKFHDFQAEVDELAGEVMDVVKPHDDDSMVFLALDTMREFKAAGVHVQVIVDIEDDGMPVNVFVIFEVQPGINFAI